MPIIDLIIYNLIQFNLNFSCKKADTILLKVPLILKGFKRDINYVEFIVS